MTLIHTVRHPDSEGPLPTLIALHGHGADAADLLGLGAILAGGRLLMICPQAEFSVDPNYPGYTWFSPGMGGRHTPEQFERTVGVVSAFIDCALDRYPVDPDRVALLGFSQGGSIGYRLALSDPRRFAGFAALSTSFSAEAATGIATTPELREFPVLLQHGADDPAIPIARAREARERLQALRIDPDYREYAMGHEIGQRSGRDLSAWLERVLGLG